MNRTLKDNLSFLVPWAATVVFLIILNFVIRLLSSQNQSKNYLEKADCL